MKKKVVILSAVSIATALFVWATFAYQDGFNNFDMRKWGNMWRHFQLSWSDLSGGMQKLGSMWSFMDETILDMTYQEFQTKYNTRLTETQFDDMQARVLERESNRAKADEFKETIQIAIAQNDFEMFKEAIAIDDHNGNLSVIDTESKFSKFVQMHQYLDQADEIRTELWLEDRPMMGKMKWRNRQTQ